MDHGKEQREFTKSNLIYSVQRIDLLLISISGAGIYAGWELFKYIKLSNHAVNFNLLVASELLFLFAIITNFLGQWAAYKTHLNELVEKPDLRDFYNAFVYRFNNTSIFFMITGLFCLSIFIFISLD